MEIQDLKEAVLKEAGDKVKDLDLKELNKHIEIEFC